MSDTPHLPDHNTLDIPEHGAANTPPMFDSDGNPTEAYQRITMLSSLDRFYLWRKPPPDNLDEIQDRYTAMNLEQLQVEVHRLHKLESDILQGQIVLRLLNVLCYHSGIIMWDEVWANYSNRDVCPTDQNLQKNK